MVCHRLAGALACWQSVGVAGIGGPPEFNGPEALNVPKRTPNKSGSPPKKPPKKALVKCKFCDYTCHGKQALGRHIYYQHPEHRLAGAKVSVSMATLRDLLALLENAMSKKQSAAYHALANALTAQEVRLRVTLAAVALDKAERIACLGPVLKHFDSILVRRIEEDKELKKFKTVEQLMTAQERLRTTLTGEADFLERILSLKGPASSELFNQLIGTLRNAEVEAQGLIEGKSKVVGEAEDLMQLSTAERENVRRVFRSILTQVKPAELGEVKKP